MIKLIDILNNINEGKQVGDLYHFTTMKNLPNILQYNCLKDRKASGEEKLFDKKNYYVSFTRNKNFNKVAQIFNLRTGINFNYSGCVCRIKLNGNEISNNFSIEPARDSVFSSDNSSSKWSKIPKVVKKGKKYYSADENEERIYTNKCFPLNKYIENITLIDPSERDIEIAKSLDFNNFTILNSKTNQESFL
jgi:hypothetical protein